jgi:threonine dehydrogenase-like Zn-dependent dehydrogenase
VVAEVGRSVKGVAVGDRVVIDPNIECGTCRACRRGRANLCERLGGYGVTRNGGFAEFSVVASSAVHPIGDLDYSVAALAEPMGCILNGVQAVHDPTMQNALIFGAGPMGLLMAIALRARGVADINVCDIDEARLDLAEGFGFSAAAPGSAALERLRQGVDLAVDATGAAAVAGGLVRYIANGGKGLFFGVCPSDARIELSPFEIFRRQLTLAGSHSLNHNIGQALDAITAHGAEIARVVSHRMSLEEVAQVLRTHPPERSLKVQAVPA